MGKKVLLSLIYFGVVVLLSAGVFSASFSPAVERTCEAGVCTVRLHSSPVLDLDANGKVKPFSDVANVRFINGVFRVYYRNDYYVDLEPFIVQNGKEKSIPTLRGAYPAVLFEGRTYKDRYHYKYDFGLFNIPAGLLSQLDYVGLKLVEASGISLNDIQREGYAIILNNDVRLGFEDLLSAGYVVTFPNKTALLISNLSANLNGNNLRFDPTVTLQTAETQNLEDTATNAGAGGSSGANVYVAVGKTGGGAVDYGLVKFNFSDVSYINASIISAQLCLFHYDDVNPSHTGESLTIREVHDTQWAETCFAGSCPTGGADIVTVPLTGGSDSQDFWVCSDVTDYVANWSSYNETNVSFSLYRTSSANGEHCYFASKENVNTSSRPYLEIDYGAGDFFNVTFRDETTGGLISGVQSRVLITSSFNNSVFTTTDGTISEVYNYSIHGTAFTAVANATGYGTRRKFLTGTNISTTFYLPAANETQETIFTIKDEDDRVLKDVIISCRRLIGGSLPEIGQELTDFAGQAVWDFIVPDITYTCEFNKTGYSTRVENVTPLSPYDYTLWLFSESDIDLSTALDGVFYNFTPTDYVLPQRNTNFTFLTISPPGRIAYVNVNSTLESVLYSNTSTNVTGDYLTLVLNLSNITGYFTVNYNIKVAGYPLITYSIPYYASNVTPSPVSFFSWAADYKDLFTERQRAMIAVFSAAAGAITLSSLGIPLAGGGMVAAFILIFFSAVGWISKVLVGFVLVLVVGAWIALSRGGAA